MEKHHPPRWHQRLNNYSNALNQLKSAVALSQQRTLSELEKQGLIQSFKFTHELAWNVLKDYFLIKEIQISPGRKMLYAKLSTKGSS